MRWACAIASSPQNKRMQYGTGRNWRTITILPLQLRSQKLTVRDWNPAHRAQLVTRTVIPGVQTPKMGIGSGHRRVPNTHQYDLELKILDKISHGGASAVDKSTTGRFPYQQDTFLRGLWLNIRVNRLIRSRLLRKFVRVSVENTRSLEFLVNFEK